MCSLLPRFGLSLLVLVVLGLGLGCESSDDPPPSVDITGTWTGPCELDGAPVGNSTFFFFQDYDEIGGSIEFASIEGSVSDNVVTGFAFGTENGTTFSLSFSGTVNGNSMSLTGTQTIDDGLNVTIQSFSCALIRQ